MREKVRSCELHLGRLRVLEQDERGRCWADGLSVMDALFRCGNGWRARETSLLSDEGIGRRERKGAAVCVWEKKNGAAGIWRRE